MNIVVIGTGYVGLVQGVCLAHLGHIVTCVDIDETKIKKLENSEIPFYEPGLEEMMKRVIKSKQLNFTTSLKVALLSNPEIVFIAVGTPQAEDGSADLSAVEIVARQLGDLRYEALIVTKSTVPVGTSKKIKIWSGSQRVASNPEFLREGHAVKDFLNPDRIVIGAENKNDIQLIKELYARIDSQIFTMNAESAELSKYVSNSMLALRLSFMNEIANLCDELGADIKDIEKVVGSDVRIGNKFLRSGAGFGGSCFPKDIRALEATARKIGKSTKLISPIIEVNELQAERFVDSVEKYLGDLDGVDLAVWGLAFKEGTDDVRESPAIKIINYLVDRGARIKAYDPQAIETAKVVLGDSIEYCQNSMSSLKSTKALLVLTPWPEFFDVSWSTVLNEIETNFIFDAKNYLPHDDLHSAGFNVVGVGLWRIA